MALQPDPLIGPHEGRELALMLEGRKKLAVFHEWADRIDSLPEEVIPEKAFAPHVAAGRIVRRAEDILYGDGRTIRYVCFALPGEVWRIDAFLFMRRDAALHPRLYGDAGDIVTGRLLGYSAEEIGAFLENRKRRASGR